MSTDKRDKELSIYRLVVYFPGKEIRDDLMKMLQNKLDDALLDAICVMLSRNPQCKLKPDDISVSFEQHSS